MATVTFKVALAIRIAEAMRTMGFIPATDAGVTIQYVSAEHRVLGIVYEDASSIEKKKDLIPTRRFLGVIRFNDWGSVWKIEYYGKNSLPKIEELTEYLSNEFSIDIEVLRTDEACRYVLIETQK